MADQGPSDRFDYLFAPIDGETTTTEVPAVEPVDAAPRRRRSWALPVTAALVALLGVAAVILLWPEPVDAVPAPSVTSTHAQPTPIVTSAPVVPPQPVPPPEATAVVAPEPALPPPPGQPAPPPSSPPDHRRAPTPILRSPISVSPTPRPAFPNQIPPEGDQGRGGGLLPGLGPL